MTFKPSFSPFDCLGESRRHGDVDRALAIEFHCSAQCSKPRGSEDATRPSHTLVFARRSERAGFPEPPQLVRGDRIQWSAELVPKGGLVVVCKVLRSAFAVGLLHRDEELDRPCGQCAKEFRMAAQEHSEVVR